MLATANLDGIASNTVGPITAGVEEAVETYAVIMHLHGEILAEGEFDAREVEDLIRAHAPPPFNEQPGVAVVRAVLDGGALELDGWGMGIRKLR